MTKKIAIILVGTLLITACFAGCKKNDVENNNESVNSGEDLENGANEFDIFEDENGNSVAVIYDKDGKAYEVGEDGKKTNRRVRAADRNNGNSSNNNSDGNSNNNSNQNVVVPEKPNVDNKTDKAPETTNKNLTTLPYGKDKVPSTSDSGTPVKFSDEDVSTLAYMLEVPYLYAASYENSQGVPIEIANHAACWMAQKNGANSTSFASGDIVLNLFRYFAQTVRNYSNNCNTDKSANKAPITYNSANDTFTIIAKESTAIEKQTHSVTIESIEFLSNNNYYKVTASVKAENSSGCKYKKVVAVMQKNLLDSSLGFSVKALKWS